MRFRLMTLAFLMCVAAGLFAQPAKVTMIGPPKRALIGTDVTFCVLFENTSTTQVGFGPFIDLVLDAAGGTSMSPCDGLTYTSATLVHTNPSLPLNAVATPQTATPCGPVTSSTGFTHPWNPPATPPA